MPKTVTLTFHPASEPPDDDRTVFCSDENFTMTGYYDPSASLLPGWYCSDGSPWPEVRTWADLPKAEECI